MLLVEKSKLLLGLLEIDFVGLSHKTLLMSFLLESFNEFFIRFLWWVFTLGANWRRFALASINLYDDERINKLLVYKRNMKTIQSKSKKSVTRSIVLDVSSLYIPALAVVHDHEYQKLLTNLVKKKIKLLCHHTSKTHYQKHEKNSVSVQ